MRNKTIKAFLSLILTLMLFAPMSHVAAVTKTGVVDVTSGVLNVRSGPGTKYHIIGTLKGKTKVTVYSLKNGCAQIKYGKKKAYVCDDYLRFYSTMSSTSAKKIVDKALAIERKTWKKNYTKSQIYAIMAPGFTKTYTKKYFKQQFRKAGKDRNGNQLHHIIETEIWGLALYPIDWKHSKKPTITHYTKNNREYLYVSQYHINEESGNQTTTICLYKSGTKWLVFDHRVKQGDGSRVSN